MSDTTVTILAVLIVFLVLIVVYKHINLQVQIRDIFNVQLKADKDKESCEDKKEEPDSHSDSSPEQKQV